MSRHSCPYSDLEERNLHFAAAICYEIKQSCQTLFGNVISDARENLLIIECVLAVDFACMPLHQHFSLFLGVLRKMRVASAQHHFMWSRRGLLNRFFGLDLLLH